MPGADDESRADRYNLRPAVEKNFQGYELFHKRLLQGAAGLGLAGLLGKQAWPAVTLATDFSVRLSGGFLLFAALILAVMTTPLFVAVYAALIGRERFHIDPKRMNLLGRSLSFDVWGFVFAIPSVVMFFALVTVLTDWLDREVQK